MVQLLRSLQADVVDGSKVVVLAVGTDRHRGCNGALLRL
jgi:hypothetical protein